MVRHVICVFMCMFAVGVPTSVSLSANESKNNSYVLSKHSVVCSLKAACQCPDTNI